MNRLQTDRDKFAHDPRKISYIEMKRLYLRKGAMSQIKQTSYIHVILRDTEKPTTKECKEKLTFDLLAFLNHSTPSELAIRGPNRETLAHAVAKLDLPEVMNYLVKNYPRIIRTTDKFEHYPWHTAARCGSVDVLERLSGGDFDVDSRLEATEWSILHIATLLNQTDVIKFFLDNNIMSVDHKDIHKRTSLFLAMQYRKKEAAYLLLKYGADETEKSMLNITPMGISAYFMPELTIHFLDE